MFNLFRKKAGFDALEFAHDYHCHVLPGVDDGSKSVEESLGILREMVAMGFKSVVLTPHLNPDVYPLSNESIIRLRYEDFIKSLPSDITSAIEISLGAEYMVTQGFEDRDSAELLQFIPGKVLIEMSYMYPSKNMEQTIFNLGMAGLKPVIAHPERYLYYAHNVSVFERLHDMGAEYQMNAFSLCGAYGRESMTILDYILGKGWYSYISTDTHSVAHLKRLQDMSFDASLLESCKKIL